jgi:hypothetical protein
VTRVSAFFGGCGTISAIFFNRVFELSLLRNAQKRDKKKSSKTTEGEKNLEETKATFFVISLYGFLDLFLSCF